MEKFTVTLSKEHGGKYYQTVVEAESEQEAFLIAAREAKEKGIILPDEVWTRFKKHKNDTERR